MKIKALIVAAFAAVLMAVVGGVLLRQATFTQATPTTMPVQPFAPGITSALMSTVLGTTGAGGTAGLHFNINVPLGNRQTLPTFYSNGFPLRPDKDIPDEVTVTGGVRADVDIFCDGGVDLLAQNDAPTFSSYTFYEQTTNVDTDGQLGTDDEDYVRFNSPLWEMVARLRADLVGLWIGGTSGFFYSLPTALPLNSTQMQVPWMPDTHAGQVTLGGDPGPPNGVCQDSPQNSESTEIGVMDNPPEEGDSGGVCLTCVDKGITMWSAYPASLVGPAALTTVTKKVHNNGPATGTFTDKWVAELPDVVSTTGAPGPDGIPDVGVQWVAVPADGDVCTEFGVVVPCTNPMITDLEVPETVLMVGATRTYTRSIGVACLSSGNYRALVALKNILLPTGAKDQYLANNAATTMIQIDCGNVSGQTSVDKSVVWVKPTGVTGIDPANTFSLAESTANHLQLVQNDTVTVSVDELKVYHPDESDDTPVDGRETLEAEAPAGINLNWVDVLGDTCTTNGVVVPCTNTDVNDLEFTVPENAGEQMDEVRNLEITCTPAALALTMPQPVVIKAIDRPIPPFKEDVKHDNLAHQVIKVWCYANDTAVGAAMDGIDDGTGLYLRWTAFISNPDNRKSFVATAMADTASPSDTAYVERRVIPECFYIDADGAPDGGDGWVTAIESQADPNIVGGSYAAIDADGDCLINAAHAQPSHKVDSLDTPTGILCPPLVYSDSGGTIKVQYDTAADQDCDGLTDGVEAYWGSDPTIKDTDGDGSSDFLEMFEFTNPRDPDTDNDLIKDKPDDDYVAAPVGGNETAEAVNADDNCPTKPNPGQENNDGKQIVNGAGIPGAVTSNPMADTQGDACDTDDDNDAISDVAELKYAESGSCTLNPLKGDSDGDHALDGNEIQMGADPCLNAATPAALTSAQTALFRGGGFNVPAQGSYGGVYNAQNDMDMTDNREKNADADYTGAPAIGTSVNSFADGGLDKDNDDGSNGNPSEISDVVEVKGFNTGPSKLDSDGDGCLDWIEIADVNGDRKANVLDVLQVAQTGLGGEVTTEPDLGILDINKDRQVNILDVQVEAKNSDLIVAKAHAKCPSDTERAIDP